MSDRPVSEETIHFIKNEEGFRSHAYQCQAGIWTIGFGTTSLNGHPVHPGDTITEAEADRACREDAKAKQAQVLRLVKVPINDHQLTALVSFAYNFGTGLNGLGGSTLLKKINAGKLGEAANEFARWVHVRDPISGKMKVSSGLIARRKRERDLFLK